MKIAYVVETYTDGLGYIDNILPKRLVELGDDVHVITCRLPPYYHQAESFFGSLSHRRDYTAEVHEDGVVIHTLPYALLGRRVFIKGLHKALREIRPDTVIVRGMSSPVLGQVVLSKFILKFRIFTSTGQAYSAVPAVVRTGGSFSLHRLRYIYSRSLFGGLFNLFVRQCIASSSDGALVATEFFGVPANKVVVIPLGVDTEKFLPADNENLLTERRLLRSDLGVSDSEIVCIWTGRMSGHKGLGLLAKAVEELSGEGYPYTALFIGDGPESEDLQGFKKVIRKPFLPWADLPPYYRAADIAVWPRSITTSTLDASACGLPVIMSNQEQARERWEGIGEVYEEGSVASLKQKLLKFHKKEYRTMIGKQAVSMMRASFSWNSIAKKYQVELLKNPR